MAVSNGSGSDKAEQIMAWAQENGEAFTGGDVATALGVKPHNVGSALRGLVTKGMLKISDPREGKRTYALPPLNSSYDIAVLADSTFEADLKVELTDRLTDINAEYNTLVERTNALDGEASQIRTALDVLNP